MQVAEGEQTTAVKHLSIGEKKNNNIWDYFSSQNNQMHKHQYGSDFQTHYLVLLAPLFYCCGHN